MDFVSKEMMEKQNEKQDIKQTESCISEVVHPGKVNIGELSRQLGAIGKKDYKNIKKIDIIPYITSEREIADYFSVSGGKVRGNATCFLPWRAFAFTTDGKVLIHIRCFNYVYGDFAREGIGEIFHNERIEFFRKKLRESDYCFPACTRCCGVMTYGMGPK